jgi:hypothetical protein
VVHTKMVMYIVDIGVRKVWVKCFMVEVEAKLALDHLLVLYEVDV